VPNAAGNAVFAGTSALAASPAGVAFGAGAGNAANLGAVIVLRARALAAVFGPGPLLAVGIGHADPAPDPFLDIFNDAAVLGAFGLSGSIPDVPTLTEPEFESDLAANAITPANPGSTGDVALNIAFDDPGDQLLFAFSGSYLLETMGLDAFSASLSLRSESLGIRRSFAYDETGVFQFQGGWSSGDLDFGQTGGRVDIDVGDLGFAISVGPTFSLDDFYTTDFVLQSINSAAIPEPATLAMLLAGLALVRVFPGARNKH
jgi:hypothetical protein